MDKAESGLLRMEMYQIFSYIMFFFWFKFNKFLASEVGKLKIKVPKNKLGCYISYWTNMVVFAKQL